MVNVNTSLMTIHVTFTSHTNINIFITKHKLMSLWRTLAANKKQWRVEVSLASVNPGLECCHGYKYPDMIGSVHGHLLTATNDTWGKWWLPFSL